MVTEYETEGWFSRIADSIKGIFGGIAIFLIAIPLIYPMPIMILGFVVCVVQTAVFCLLSMVYINLALEDLSHGHGEEGHH